MHFNISDIPSLDIKIKHRNWRLAYAEAFSILSIAQPGEVVCITGPSRVGKSRLAKELSVLLEGENKFEETGLMNTVMVEAANSGQHGAFSTKAFIQRLLGAVHHPILSMGDAAINDLFVVHKMDKSTESTLRLAVERALIARKVRYLIIDEAQHVRYATRGAQAPHAVMDSWKCLAESAGVILVMVGAYPILDVIRKSPHLIGRKHQIHMPRYSHDDEDLQEFVSIIKSYEEIIELDKSISSLWQNYEMLYEGTFGCIGLLRAWLTRASAFAYANGSGITMDILKKSMLSESDRKEVKAEILEGENLLSNNVVDIFSKVSIKEKNSTCKEKIKNIVKPFQRKPKRMKPGHRTKGPDDDS